MQGNKAAPATLSAGALRGEGFPLQGSQAVMHQGSKHPCRAPSTQQCSKHSSNTGYHTELQLGL